MIETLLQIPGQVFLLYFICAAVVCIGAGWLWANLDGSTQYSLPDINYFDPITIAALRGGGASVIKAVVFSFWVQNLVDIKGEGKDTEIKSMGASQKSQGTIEKEIYQFLQTPRKPRDLFQDEGLRSLIEAYLEPVYQKLEHLHLTRTAADHTRAWTAAIVMAIVLVGLGGSKIYLGITHNHPVLFLVILLIVSLFILYAIVSPNAIPTRLGRRYLKELEENFNWIKDSITAERIPDGINPALVVAIFGVGALSETYFYGLFTQAFHSNSSGGGCGGGCGAGCGSDDGNGGCGGCGCG